MATGAPPVFTVESLGRALIAPDAGEQLAPLPDSSGKQGPGALVLDLEASSPDIASCDVERLLYALSTLPSVTIAVAGEAVAGGAVMDKAAASDADDPRSTLVRGCDVAVSSEAEVDGLVAGFRETPIAALAFVQHLRVGAALAFVEHLRVGAGRAIHEALVAESFVYSTLQSGAEFEAWRATRQKKRRKRTTSTETVPSRSVRMERDRGVLEIWLTRAEKHNAFSRAMRDGLTEALELALADPSIEEVVLEGEGLSFCSGGDLDEFGSFSDPARAHAIRTTRSPARLLSELARREGVRTRTHVHGACIGAGAELPAFTEHVVAEEDAFFQLPEVALGLIPGAGGTVSLPRRIGRQRTAWLGLSGERIDARKALDWGLVDEVRLGQHVPSSQDDQSQRNR